MGENDNKNKFYFFKIDKDKIKLQLKNISSKFIKPKKNRKLISIVLTFCLLIGVAIALYSNSFNSNMSTDSLTGKHQQEKSSLNTEETEYSSSESIDISNKSLSLPENKKQPKEIQTDDRKAKEINPDREPKSEEAEGVVTESVANVQENNDREQIKLLKPVAGEVISEPGWYFHPVFEDWRYQKGVKLNGSNGDIVMAAESGKVTDIYEDQYKGVTVKIKHDNGWQTQYSYLQKTPLTEGEVVGKGQEVGRIGSTGITKQPCLYFELLNREKVVNPVEFLDQ